MIEQIESIVVDVNAAHVALFSIRNQLMDVEREFKKLARDYSEFCADGATIISIYLHVPGGERVQHIEIETLNQAELILAFKKRMEARLWELVAKYEHLIKEARAVG